MGFQLGRWFEMNKCGTKIRALQHMQEAPAAWQELRWVHPFAA
jgi:hypothetical protein